ncbi:glucan biosynthesis protein G [Edwardsiella piscicida]|nr:glucan biosynthesis protein G [Edwardsiella piscicida]EKS7778913.1 glucan biosynthesis protein G [Edwardsiella piscicida]EKS7782333.1 glucan biosynthesis protein G [Edwardsiella piscicida]EKS7791968.1 glucan biosynthesis protein G [Edwardsiella piscicida]EKS7812082.1 glucan biosynthesis protein G [Edwardsiella piscicida]ELM3729974.1 glucan biosynthesis protein G [Edwardsiella piscicida]
MLTRLISIRPTSRSVSGLAVSMLMMFASAQAWAFSLDDVAAQAQKLAEQSYKAPKSNLPSEFRNMKFADYQQIQFNNDKLYWTGQKNPFRLAFYHQGMYFDTPVKINEVTATSVKEIKYNPDYFNFGSVKHDKDAVKDLGFAGFKVLYPINKAGKDDEIMSMLGASYFRVIGKGQVYGLSARGLAIDTALPSGEEFPRFREFWIERPKPQDKHLVIFALLDSPRATGAYRFILRPGTDTVVDVQARVFLRDKVGVLGIAPLTSMYLFGANQPSPTVNYRPQLHDSEGLSIASGNGEWIWRPLNNPKHLSVSTFSVDDLKGFGLLQRTRDFSAYQDLDDRYDLRPGAWIEPRGNWGKGKVELVEIPTADETNDNIVAFWIPDSLPPIGKPLDMAYRLIFTRDEAKLHNPDLAWVKSTLRSAGDVKQSNLIREADGSTALLVDFVGPVLKGLEPDAPVTTQVTTDDNTKLLENSLHYNPVTKGWRLTLRFKVNDPKKPVEMRAYLIKDGKPLSETWSYQLPANE